MLENVGKSIPEATGSWSDCKAFYRLLGRPEITFESLLECHRSSSLLRAAGTGEAVVLNIQDTSTLNFQTHEKLEGQGPIGASDKTTGFHLHATALAGADSGRFHGILGAKLYARDADKRRKGAKGARNRERIEEKESYRWMESLDMSVACRTELETLAGRTGAPAARVVNVGDREADIYELLLEARRHCQRGVHLLVRSQHNRKLEIPEGEKDESREGEEARLWDMLSKEPCRGKVVLEIPRRRGIEPREAVCEVRFKELTLATPRHKAKYTGARETITVTAVELVEKDDKRSDRIHWRLLTTWPVETPEEALRVVRWYSRRWHIEVYFRVLKTGCQVEDRQLRTIEKLWPMIALDMITASYLMGLTTCARSHPAAPATEFFVLDELEALGAYHGLESRARQEMTLAEAVKLVAKLGGHLGRKGDGPPGAEVLWRGITKLHHITEAWEMFTNREKCG